jgi:hypothetical protein
MYQRIKRRFIEDAQVDPILLHLMMVQPELVVEVERREIVLNATDGARGRVARLLADGYFQQARTGGAVRAELKRTGTDPGTTVYDVLGKFVVDGFLVRESDSFVLAAGVTVTKREKVSVV